MGEKVPESTLYRIQCDVSKLPVSSFRRRGTYATFQPFETYDDNDALGNNQLNWTNLFLWNKFGKTLSVTDAEGATSIISINSSTAVNEATLSQVKKIGKTLSDEFKEVKKMIEGMKNPSDLSTVQSAIQNVIRENNYEYKFLKIEARLNSLEKSVADIKVLTQQIAERFGIK